METTSSTDDSKASPEGLADTASQTADTVPEAASKSASRPFTIARPSFRTVESTTKYPPLITRMSAHDKSPRHSVKFTFSHEGTQPPVYVAGSFTSPPWEPQEMAVSEEKTDSNDLIFYKEFDTIEEGEYQYKFRLGSGDWWVLDEKAASVTDDSGNRNNLLVVKPEPTPAALPTPPSEEASQEPIPTVTNHTVKDLETQPGGQATEEPQFGENPVASGKQEQETPSPALASAPAPAPAPASASAFVAVSAVSAPAPVAKDPKEENTPSSEEKEIPEQAPAPEGELTKEPDTENIPETKEEKEAPEASTLLADVSDEQKATRSALEKSDEDVVLPGEAPKAQVEEPKPDPVSEEIASALVSVDAQTSKDEAPPEESPPAEPPQAEAELKEIVSEPVISAAQDEAKTDAEDEPKHSTVSEGQQLVAEKTSVKEEAVVPPPEEEVTAVAVATPEVPQDIEHITAPESMAEAPKKEEIKLPSSAPIGEVESAAPSTKVAQKTDPAPEVESAPAEAEIKEDAGVDPIVEAEVEKATEPASQEPKAGTAATVVPTPQTIEPSKVSTEKARDSGLVSPSEVVPKDDTPPVAVEQPKTAEAPEQSEPPPDSVVEEPKPKSSELTPTPEAEPEISKAQEPFQIPAAAEDTPATAEPGKATEAEETSEAQLRTTESVLQTEPSEVAPEPPKEEPAGTSAPDLVEQAKTEELQGEPPGTAEKVQESVEQSTDLEAEHPPSIKEIEEEIFPHAERTVEAPLPQPAPEEKDLSSTEPGSQSAETQEPTQSPIEEPSSPIEKQVEKTEEVIPVEPQSESQAQAPEPSKASADEPMPTSSEKIDVSSRAQAEPSGIEDFVIEPEAESAPVAAPEEPSGQQIDALEIEAENSDPVKAVEEAVEPTLEEVSAPTEEPKELEIAPEETKEVPSEAQPSTVEAEAPQVCETKAEIAVSEAGLTVEAPKDAPKETESKQSEKALEHETQPEFTADPSAALQKDEAAAIVEPEPEAETPKDASTEPEIQPEPILEPAVEATDKPIPEPEAIADLEGPGESAPESRRESRAEPVVKPVAEPEIKEKQADVEQTSETPVVVPSAEEESHLTDPIAGTAREGIPDSEIEGQLEDETRASLDAEKPAQPELKSTNEALYEPAQEREIANEDAVVKEPANEVLAVEPENESQPAASTEQSLFRGPVEGANTDASEAKGLPANEIKQPVQVPEEAAEDAAEKDETKLNETHEVPPVLADAVGEPESVSRAVPGPSGLEKDITSQTRDDVAAQPPEPEPVQVIDSVSAATGSQVEVVSLPVAQEPVESVSVSEEVPEETFAKTLDQETSTNTQDEASALPSKNESANTDVPSIDSQEPSLIPFTVVDKVPEQEQPVYGDTEPKSLGEDSEKRTADAERDAEYISPNVAAQPEQPTETSEVPTLIIEKTGDEPAHGDDFGRDATPGQNEAHEKRAADAEPDHVIVSPETNEPPYEETEAPLLSHESTEMEEEDAPLFAHEVSYENADEPSPSGEQPVTTEAGISLFAHEVSHEDTGRLSATGQQKGPSSVGSAASYDSDVHDPSVEAFPTTKEEIYRQLELTESRLREDEVVTEGIPPSPLRHTPSLSKTASVADAASPLEAIGEDEESEEDVKPVDLPAPIIAPPEPEHIEDIATHVVEPTQPAPEEIPSETIAKDELTLENVDHIPDSSAPAPTGSNASEGEARNLSGSTDGVAESKVTAPSTVPESESTVPESQASSDQVATTTADKDTAPEPVPAPESKPDLASVTIPDSTSAPSAPAEEVPLTPPLTPKDVLTAPAPASSADAVVREAEESKEVADQTGQPGEPESVDDGPAVEPSAEGKVESEDQHDVATSKHIEEGQAAHGEETGKGKEPERQGAGEGEEIGGPVEGTEGEGEGEGEGAPELESEGLRQRKIVPQESQQKSNGDTAAAKSRDRSADRESATAAAREEEPAGERAGTVGLHHGKNGWMASLWQSLFGSWLGPIGRFLAKCFGAGGGRNA